MRGCVRFTHREKGLRRFESHPNTHGRAVIRADLCPGVRISLVRVVVEAARKKVRSFVVLLSLVVVDKDVVGVEVRRPGPGAGHAGSVVRARTERNNGTEGALLLRW